MRLVSVKDLQGISESDLREALSHVQIIPKIESYLEDKNLEDNGRALEVFSASDIGSRGGRSLCGHYTMGCSRMLYYRYVGLEPQHNFPPRSRRILDTGTKIHEQLQSYLRDFADYNEAEIFIDEANMNGSNSEVAYNLEIDSTTDGIWEVKVPDMHLRFGIEIKSINDDGFKGLNKPHGENIIQSHIYMGCLDLPVMTILYYNKNDSLMNEYCVPFDQTIWEAIVKKINFVRTHAVNEEPPPREVGFHCRQCRYSFVCKPPKRTKHSMKAARNKFRL